MYAGQRRESGFTVIELMATIGIIGVLIAIGVPALLQARSPAQDRQAQNLLRNSLTAAKAIETTEYATPTLVLLSTEEIGISFVDATSSAPARSRNVSVGTGIVGSSWYLVLTSHSTSGRCFALLEQPFQQPLFQRLDNSVTCQADQFDAIAGWQDKWP